MSGLAVDPSRQAKDTLRGYVYQVLRSVLVWIDLRNGEELYLEGAEDLDRIDGTHALIEQVKDTAGSGNITLRTTSVVEAINNFWTHTVRNVESTVRFRYLTTSRIGIEKGAPFGKGQSGLARWNAARAAPNKPEATHIAAAIAKFLLDEGMVTGEVRDFLSAAPPKQILDQLIGPVAWLAGRRDGTDLVRQIKDRLVEHGAGSNVAPADAERAFDALYTAAFDAAVSKDAIPLTRGQFLRIFAGANAIQMQKEDLLTLVHAALGAGPSSAVMVQAPAITLEGPPPLPQRYYRRTAQEQRLEQALAGGAVLLFGSTGTGKTLTAASTFAGQAPLWLSLRDLNPAEIKTRLGVAAALLKAEARAQTLVVDDIDTLADPRMIESALSRLWRCQKTLGGRLVLTSDRPLPARLAQAVELDEARELQMQPFDNAEIEALLCQSGCPAEASGLWAKLLELSTLGHPQLVNARVTALAAHDFPNAVPEDLFLTPPDVDRIRFETRRLIDALPDGARELLYRTSLLTGSVSRQRLITIARLATPVAEPGAAVDVIAGPWLELTDDGAFRVSPLTRGAAEQARGSAWVKAMHGQLAWTYLIERSITPWDISSVLMHCYLGGNAGPLAKMMPSIFSASEEVWAAIGEACGFYAKLALEQGGVLPFDRPAERHTFRVFQYRIAAETDPDSAGRVAARIEQELEAAPADDVTRFFRFLYLSQLLTALKVKYPIPFIVQRACDFIEIARTLETTLPERMQRAGIATDGSIPAGDYVQFASLRLLSHIEDIDDFAALIDALKSRAAEEARDLLNSIGEPDSLASVIVERLWLADFHAKHNRWPAFRATLRAGFDLAADVGATSMARGIAPVLLRVIDEDVGDPKAAVAEANVLGPTVGDDPIYRSALAKVLGHAGDYTKAATIWKEALPRWPNPKEDIGSAFAYRATAISAGNAGAWEDSAAFFDGARSLTDATGRPTFHIGLTMDAAFCRFMGGHQAAAVKEFGAVIVSLEVLQAELEQEPLLSLQRRVGGVLSALAGGEVAEDALRNLVGLCSNLDPLQTESTVAPVLDILRMDLIRVELAHGATLDCSIREAAILRTSPILSFRAAIAPSLFSLAQRTLNFSPIVDEGLRHLDALAAMAEQLANGERDVMRHADDVPRAWAPSADELLIGNMVVAVFDLAAANELDRLPLGEWRADAEAHPQGKRIVDLIEHLEGLFVTGSTDAWDTVCNCTSGDWSHQVTSALAATLLERLAPSALLRCHAIWAHHLAQPHLRPLAVVSVEQMVRRRWSAMTQLPALLTSPRTSVPGLRDAIDDPSEGWAKTRLVLQAALEAAPLPKEDWTRQAIEAMMP